MPNKPVALDSPAGGLPKFFQTPTKTVQVASDTPVYFHVMLQVEPTHVA